MTDNTPSPTFVETIRMCQGRAERLALHAARMERTMQHFFPTAPTISLDQVEEYIYNNNVYAAESGVMKCRIVYDRQILSISIEPYKVRDVGSLKLVDGKDISYSYKSSDRKHLTQLFAQRGNADDVLIVKDGLLTDTSIGNVALLVQGEWLTPAKPLLKGTRREALLQEGIIKEATLKPSDLQNCNSIMVFNAMIPWGRIEVKTGNIGYIAH